VLPTVLALAGEVAVFDRDHKLGQVAAADDPAERASATSIPAAVQRLRISPSRQNFTLRCVWRTISIIDSHGFVDASV
jgi:hypothetical protein